MVLMMRVLVLFVSALIMMTSAACSGNPSAPSRLPGSEAPSSAPASNAQFLSIGCQLELDGYRCTATLPTGNDDVTGLATWSTSDTSIATTNSVGFVTVIRAGEVAIRAKYGETAGFLVMQVEPGGSRRYYRALSGWVRDAQTEAKLSGVRVEIIDGTNAGRTTVTGGDGAYQLYDLEPGAFTVRFAKAGYVTTEHGFNLPGDGFNSLDARLAR